MLPPNLDELDAYKDYAQIRDHTSGPATDPYNGLVFYELSHEWGTGVPSYPGDADVIFDHGVKHAQFGVQAFKVRTNFHTGTHLIAPIHMYCYGEDLEKLSPDHYFGNGPILDLRHKKNWDKITAEDLKAAGEIREGDFDAVTGKRCFFTAFPWRFHMGEGSGVRVLAITDPEQSFRFETGEAVKK